jgi:carbon storage regulator
MLILTRRPAETIYIGEQVTVTVLGVVGNQVRFGIEAPRSITIDRAEIYERKKRAAQGSGPNGVQNGQSNGQSDGHSNGQSHAQSNGQGIGNRNGAPNGNVADRHAGSDEQHEDEVNGNVADAPALHAAAASAKMRR